MLKKNSNVYTKFCLVLFIAFYSFLNFNQAYSKQSEDDHNIIQLRQLAMQGMWLRVKRLIPYVEAESPIEYGPTEAIKDADELVLLLDQVENLWPKSSNISHFGYTNANPSVWAVPDYFSKLYSDAQSSAEGLQLSLKEGNDNSAVNFMCQLGKSCGSCHASFRRLLTTQLSNEAGDWSGKYIKECN